MQVFRINNDGTTTEVQSEGQVKDILKKIDKEEYEILMADKRYEAINAILPQVCTRSLQTLERNPERGKDDLPLREGPPWGIDRVPKHSPFSACRRYKIGTDGAH